MMILGNRKKIQIGRQGGSSVAVIEILGTSRLANNDAVYKKSGGGLPYLP